ncbi:Transmembrane amino acid transporter family protein [Klebsormidium nitens]|uniref:Transmembrane amino acid transporter family protein n=1 Tax=Klebsormidium nitens TaxID=105231 RepID=A0A1Y1HZX1_KLENI|nr:Transmembrane amino acid transporter family protein [Klebsormidium nitens]|eukprot:GAQ84205.1 Transmembrane amino acid transporter family protein [Klebsormidium nitens]
MADPERGGRVETPSPSSLTIPLLEDEAAKGPKAPDGGISWLSVFNLANAAIGAGVLAFPYAFREAGVFGGLAATFIIAIIEISALCVLTRSAQRFSAPSYQELVYTALGQRVSNLVSSFMWIYLFGSCVAYLIIIGDVFQPAAQTLFGASHFLAQRWVVLSLFAVLVVLPLCLKRTLRSLGVVSSIAPTTLIYLAIAILLYGARRVVVTGGIPDDVVLFGTFTGYCKAAPIVVFAFQCHIQCMPIFSELVHHYTKGVNPLDAEKWSVVRRQIIVSMDKVILLALGTCLVGYSLVGAFGYIAIPDVQSDVLSSFGEDNLVMYVARVGMGLVAIVSYPINHFPARLIEMSVLNFFWPLPNPYDPKRYMLRFNILTVAYVAVTLAVAIAVQDLGQVYMVIGSTGGVLVIFIMPGILLLDAAGMLPSRRRTLVSRPWVTSEAEGSDTTERAKPEVESGQSSRRVSESGILVVEGRSEYEEASARGEGSPSIQTIPSPHFTSIPHVGQRPSEESDEAESDYTYLGKSQRSLAALWAFLMIFMGGLIFGVTVWIVVVKRGGMASF